VLTELCGDNFDEDNTCIENCKEETTGKSVTSKAASKKCFKSAPTCEAASSCPSLLEDASDDPTGGGVSSGGGVGIGTGGTGGGGTSSKLAEAICERSVECQSGSGLTLNQCISAVSVFLEPLGSIIESGAADCIGNASCEDLEKNQEEIMTVCTGVNPNNGTCVGPTTMQLCNSSGACTNIDCKKLCGAGDSGAEGTCEKNNCACESKIEVEVESADNSSSEGASSTPLPEPEG
jgi:hypothetical protein